MKKILFTLSVLGLNAFFAGAQMVVNPGVPPSQLVAAITGPGITISGITTNGATPISQGTFDCTGACNIGISQGIILTSGSAVIAATPNTVTGQGAAINGLSDPDLTTLTLGATLDASVLEFDFIAVSDSVQFNYIFASDEYSDYVNSQFNDVFGFFISGPGITGMQNIALVPGTATPIAINNVNNGGPVGHGTPPPGPCTNCAYFLDNSAPVSFTTAYDGLTTVLTALATNLQPGLFYHLKLAISDVSDQIFDSGVFVEEGSFLTNGPAWMFAGGNRILNDTVHLCQGNSVEISAPAGFSYLWNTGSTAQSILVNQAGIYSVEITGSNTNVSVTSPMITVIVDAVIVPSPVLSQNGNSLYSSVNSPNYNYSWTLNGNPLTGANSPILTINQNGCYAVTVQDPLGCFATSDSLCITLTGIAEIKESISHQLLPNPFSTSAQLIFENKQNENYNLTIFDLTGRAQRIIKNINTGKIIIEKENLSAGIYFYELKNETGNKTYNGKFVIN